MIEILVGEELIDVSGKQIITIGRSKDCDVVISDRTVSRKHATIYINQKTGVTTIIDGDLISNTSSANGVRINGTKMNPDYGEILQDGDVVELSPVVSFRFFCKNIVVSDEQSTVL